MLVDAGMQETILEQGSNDVSIWLKCEQFKNMECSKPFTKKLLLSVSSSLSDIIWNITDPFHKKIYVTTYQN